MSTRWTTAMAAMISALSMAACLADPSPGVGGASDPPGNECPAVAFDCAVGTGPADTDGDGCVDACKPVVPQACPPIAIDCARGYEPADADGDGCVDACEPKACALAIDCLQGYLPADEDGDGCDDSCVAQK